MDFRDMAKRAKDAHQHKVSEQETRKREAEAEEQRVWEEAVTLLDRLVRPLLEEARIGFGEEGIPLVIETVRGTVRAPTIQVQAVAQPGGPSGPARRSTAVRFDYWLGEVRAYSGTNYGHGQIFRGMTVDEQVQAALQHVLKTFLEGH